MLWIRIRWIVIRIQAFCRIQIFDNKKFKNNKVDKKTYKLYFQSVLRIRIRDPGSGIGYPFDPGIRDPG
jgi:hypothetical protein